MTKDDVMKQMQGFLRRRSMAEEKNPAVSGTASPESEIENTMLEVADVLDELAESFTDASDMILDLTEDLRKELKELRNTGSLMMRNHVIRVGILSLKMSTMHGKGLTQSF